jgi:hypothetical protein
MNRGPRNLLGYAYNIQQHTGNPLTFQRKNTDNKCPYFIVVADVGYIVSAIMSWPDRCLEFSTL